MIAKCVHLNNTSDGKALLKVTRLSGEHDIIELNPDQVLLLAQQALSVIYGTYNLVPREGFKQ